MTDKLDEFLISMLYQKKQIDVLKKEILLRKSELVLEENKQGDWEYLVDRLIASEYQTENLYGALHIIEQLKNETDMENAKNFLDQKETFSKMIIAHLVLYFSEQGPQFYREMADHDLSADEELMLFQKEVENERMKKEAKVKTKKLSK